ncbi:hypothetical protein N9408_02445 [Opitutales bacterium]|nr:hypothetical protein [Opitutales bacterium]
MGPPARELVFLLPAYLSWFRCACWLLLNPDFYPPEFFDNSVLHDHEYDHP